MEMISYCMLTNKKHCQHRMEPAKGSYAKEWARWEKRLREILFGNADHLNSIQVQDHVRFLFCTLYNFFYYSQQRWFLSVHGSSLNSCSTLSWLWQHLCAPYIYAYHLSWPSSMQLLLKLQFEKTFVQCRIYLKAIISLSV